VSNTCGYHGGFGNALGSGIKGQRSSRQEWAKGLRKEAQVNQRRSRGTRSRDGDGSSGT
jgi:hypothetical protein